LWKKSSNTNYDRVLRFIQENPGCYLRQIRKELAISMGSVQYHSNQLQKMGKITTTKQGLYKLHFQSGIFHDHEKKILQVLNQETPREIIMFIIEQKNPTQTDIVNRIGISAPSVNWHVRRLIAFSIIDEVREGKYKRYKLHGDTADFEQLLELLKNRGATIWNKWSNRMVDTFLSFSND
jgi:predicted transcriptional regulator